MEVTQYTDDGVWFGYTFAFSAPACITRPCPRGSSWWPSAALGRHSCARSRIWKSDSGRYTKDPFRVGTNGPERKDLYQIVPKQSLEGEDEMQSRAGTMHGFRRIHASQQSIPRMMQSDAH